MNVDSHPDAAALIARARLLFPEPFRFYAERAANRLRPQGVLQGAWGQRLKMLALVLYGVPFWIVARLRGSPAPFAGSAPAGATLYFFTSRNQHDALAPVFRKDAHAVTLAHRPFLPSQLLLSRSAIHRRAFLHLPSALRLFRLGGADERRFVADFGVRYLRALAYVEAFMQVLDRAAPAVVVMASDSGTMHRSLLVACRERGVPSVYVQHAGVTDRFPALSFTHALLDGEDAREKYLRAGPCESQVALVGIAKFSGTREQVNASRELRTLGLCLSIFSSVERTEALCRELARALPDVGLVVRPHPRQAPEQIATIERLASELGFRTSQASREPSPRFLAGVDAVIAGNSSVLLDAALLNVTPIYFTGLDGPTESFHDHLRSFCEGCHRQMGTDDVYGFNRRGLTRVAASPAEVIDIVANYRRDRPPVRQKAAVYCSTIGTEWDFRSDELILRHLEQIRATPRSR